MQSSKRRGNSRRSAVRFRLSIGCFAFLVLLPANLTMVTAQQPPAASQPQPPSPAAGTEAPVITFGPEGVSLVEAVRLTLLHDPNIKLQAAAAAVQAGVVQEHRGQFDLSFLGNTTGSYRKQELTESRKQIERDTRNQLREGLEENRADAQLAQRLLDQLQVVKTAPRGSPQLQALAELDPILGAQIEIIDILSDNAINDQQRSELLTLRSEFVDKTIQDVEEGLVRGLDEFRTQEQRLINLGVAPGEEFFYDGSVSFSFEKLFRNGIFVSPYFDGLINGTNFVGKPKSGDFGGKGLEDLYTFHLGADALLPIMRGRGSVSLEAPERAAIFTEQASQSQVRFQTAVSVLNTVIAFWNLRAAQETRDIAQQSVTLQSRMAELVRGLIEAGDQPGVELARVQASEARSQARLNDTERSVHEARVALALAMGIAVTDDDATLPRAQDPFPAAPEPAALADTQVTALAAEAVQARPDITAAAQLQQASETLERGAASDLKPRLDAQVSAFYTALDEKLLSNAIDRWIGPSATIILNYEQPFGNQLFRGRLLQREADARLRRISSNDLRRTVRLNVLRAAGSLQEAIARVQMSQTAVDAYGRTIEASLEALKAGEQTLIDTIQTESQQTDARLSLVQARHDLAILIAQLRFEAGRLVAGDGSTPSIQDLITLPQAGGR
jgi:outer membrane protein TolC